MRALLWLSALLLAPGCDSLGDGPPALRPVDADAAVAVADGGALAAARARWDAAGIDDYALAYRQDCFCAINRVQVRVEDGVVVEAWLDGEPAPEDPAIDVSTVDRLFDIAADAFARAERVSARALPEALPVLASLSVDYAAELADDEVSYTVLGFERLDGR